MDIVITVSHYHIVTPPAWLQGAPQASPQFAPAPLHQTKPTEFWGRGYIFILFRCFMFHCFIKAGK